MLPDSNLPTKDGGANNRADIQIDSFYADSKSRYDIDMDELREMQSTFSRSVEKDIPRHLVISGKEFAQGNRALMGALVARYIGAEKNNMPRLHVFNDKDSREVKVNVEVSNDKEAIKLIKATKISGLPVSVQAHESRNSSKVTIFDGSGILEGIRDEDLESLLHDQAVVTVQRQKYFNKQGKKVYGKQYKLWVDRRSPPEFIYLLGERFQARLFVPKPMRCFHCQKLAHGKDSCKRKNLPATCVNCGESSHISADEHCTKESKCVNCGGSHKSSDFKCPALVQEQAILKLAAELRVSPHEAKTRMQGERRLVDYSKPTMAQVVKSCDSASERRLSSMENTLESLVKLMTERNTGEAIGSGADDRVMKRLEELEKKTEEQGAKITVLENTNKSLKEINVRHMNEIEQLKKNGSELGERYAALQKQNAEEERRNARLQEELNKGASKEDYAQCVNDLNKKCDQLRKLTKLHDELEAKHKACQKNKPVIRPKPASQAPNDALARSKHHSKAADKRAGSCERMDVSSSQPVSKREGGGKSSSS